MNNNKDIRDAFFDEIYELAKNDKNLIFITADMGANSLNKFKENLPDQFINTGIAEQNAIGIASGLALEGRNVYVYGITPFITARCYEQLKIDLSYLNVPVKVVASGQGMSYATDGPTHYSTQDISIIRALPNFTIYSPSDATSSQKIAQLSYNSKTPTYIRLDKRSYNDIYIINHDFKNGFQIIKRDRIPLLNADIKVLVITTGIIIHQVFDIDLKLKRYNKIFNSINNYKPIKLSVDIADMYRLKPIDTLNIINLLNLYDLIITIEEHSIIGGLGSIISEIITDNDLILPLIRFGISDKYPERYGTREFMYSYYKLNSDAIAQAVISRTNKYITGGS